jgi:carbon-monoxide dehydrogenase medium subunit
MSSPSEAIAIVASRKRVAPFALHRPATVVEAARLAVRLGSSAFHAGGIDLASRMKAGWRADHVVALDGIAALHGVTEAGDALRIGAMTRHWEIESDPCVCARSPSLSRFVAGLGNVRIRMQGTIGGNVMAGEPAYEMLPALAVIGASLVFADDAGVEHPIPALDWLRGQHGDARTLRLLVAVTIPLDRAVLAWNRDLRPTYGLECVAGLVVDDGQITGGRAAFIGDRTGARSAELRPAAGDPAAIARDWADRLPPISAASGASAVYCRQVAAVTLRRAIAEAIGYPTGGRRG